MWKWKKNSPDVLPTICQSYNHVRLPCNQIYYLLAFVFCVTNTLILIKWYYFCNWTSHESLDDTKNFKLHVRSEIFPISNCTLLFYVNRNWTYLNHAFIVIIMFFDEEQMVTVDSVVVVSRDVERRGLGSSLVEVKICRKYDDLRTVSGASGIGLLLSSEIISQRIKPVSGKSGFGKHSVTVTAPFTEGEYFWNIIKILIKNSIFRMSFVLKWSPINNVNFGPT